MKPDWLKVRLDAGERFGETTRLLKQMGLKTVCEGAHCPNKCACWAKGTATFMVLGETCTRRCGFCTVKKGAVSVPAKDEPRRLGDAVKGLGLHYVVITSVCRDDLPDGGAGHFAKCIGAAKKSGARVEALIPDYLGSALGDILKAQPDVISHNLETVSRLSPDVRDPRAGYEKSLRVLRTVKRLDPFVKTKSSLMLGLGETRGEVMTAMEDLRMAGVDMLTLGQYLRPSARQLPVERYLPPEEFGELEFIAERMGFACAAGPFVRSSYMAEELHGKVK